MQTKLFWAGVVLAVLAAVLGIVSTNLSAGGVPADVHPGSGIAVAVAAIAMLYASTVVPKVDAPVQTEPGGSPPARTRLD